MQTTENSSSNGLPVKDRDTEAYLARIRRTIEQSNHMVEQVGLRLAETDRMLERQGLTRDQVMAMRFSDAQIEAVNAELRRRGMDPLERWEAEDDTRREEVAPRPEPEDFVPDAELAERQRKFGMMMKPFHI